MKKFTFVLLTALLVIAMSATTMAANRYSVATGRWDRTTTWSATSGGASGASVPGAADVVFIENGYTVNVTNAAASCATLNIASGSTLNVDDQNITVSGTTNIFGTINITSTTGTKRFTGLVTINVGGVWNNSANEAINLRGGLTNNGTFTAGTGAYTFTTNNQALNGTISIPNVTVTTVTLTNNGTLTVGTALAGNGTLTNSATGVLNIGGTSTITTLNATAAGNTVNYTGAAQIVKATTYQNLTLSGSGTKTTTGVTVNGVLTMASAATASAAPTYGASASLQYTGTTVQTTGPEFLSTMSIPVLAQNSVGVIMGTPTTITNTFTIQDCYVDNSINAITVGSGGSIVLLGTGSLVAPLPVEMTSFTAVLNGSNALLKWSTATEKNNYGFHIERSAEGSGTWVEVAFVKGAGTSDAPKYYSYEDKNLAPGAYVYRIKQIDNDGTMTIYNPNELPKVDAGKSDGLKLGSNYPNPFNPSTSMQFSVPVTGHASLKVYNVIGQEVAVLFSGTAQAGHYITATFNASRLASGIYFARLQYNGQSLVQRMLMTK